MTKRRAYLCKLLVIFYHDIIPQRFRFLASINISLHHVFISHLSTLSHYLPKLSFSSVFRVLISLSLLATALEAQNGTGAENGVKAAPVIFAAVKPWSVVEAPKANDAVLFYKAAFGAEEVGRVNHSKRKAEQEIPLVVSAEIKLGSFNFVVSDLTGDSPVKSAVAGGVVCLETENVEAAVAKEVAAGAVSEGEVWEGDGACCGGRVGKVKDPYGNIWLICALSKKFGDVAE